MGRDRALAEVLKRALPPEARRRIYSLPLVETRWAAIVGEELARRSEPEALADGLLSVRVTDAAWGRTILKLQNRIIPALNQAVGADLVRRIQFVRRERLSRVRSGGASVEKRDPPGPLPESILCASEKLTDPELRELVRKSAAKYLRAREERGRS